MNHTHWLKSPIVIICMHVDVCQTHCQYSCEGRLGQKQGQNNLRFVDLEINSPLDSALV